MSDSENSARKGLVTETKPRLGTTRGPKPARGVVSQLLGKTFHRQGFAQAEVLTRWPVIVGPELARYSCPEKLAFPARGKGAGSLHVRVVGPVALEFQHRAPEIIAEVNRYFGFAAVQRLVLVQGPLPPAPRIRPPIGDPPPSPRVDGIVAGVQDSGVREALRRLGRHVDAPARAPRR